ncbi:topoisomerase [Solibacillus isronensis]|uniref:topoisomerase n=1 Tax=Solibacillus isronensis TaxID=412383 RepID=UPI0009A70F9D|nr:topoisomerase [Solibacillus isronensis]
MKKAIISGVVLCSILLGGCNNIEVIESEQEVVVSYNTLFAELQNEIIKSITEQTELDSDALAIMIDGGGGESTVAVGYPKDSKIEGTLIQQIVEDSVKNVSETETNSEERVKITIKIEKY